jgi:hypothetical protein
MEIFILLILAFPVFFFPAWARSVARRHTDIFQSVNLAGKFWKLLGLLTIRFLGVFVFFFAFALVGTLASSDDSMKPWKEFMGLMAVFGVFPYLLLILACRRVFSTRRKQIQNEIELANRLQLLPKGDQYLRDLAKAMDEKKT